MIWKRIAGFHANLDAVVIDHDVIAHDIVDLRTNLPT
jgi:hypothetical protein